MVLLTLLHIGFMKGCVIQNNPHVPPQRFVTLERTGGQQGAAGLDPSPLEVQRRGAGNRHREHICLPDCGFQIGLHHGGKAQIPAHVLRHLVGILRGAVTAHHGFEPRHHGGDGVQAAPADGAAAHTG